MRCTLYLTLLIIGYIVVVLCLANGFGKLGLNLMTFSKHQKPSEHVASSFQCFSELGIYDLFWNLSVAIPILFVCLGGLLLTALILKEPGLLSMWLIFWMALVLLNLVVHVFFLLYHCPPRDAGVLSAFVVIEAVVETTLAVWVAALWWRMVCGDLPSGRLSSYMEELAGRRWRERFGLEKDARGGPPMVAGSGAVAVTYRMPTYDTNWIVKSVSLERDHVQVLERA